MNAVFHNLPPIWDKNSRILILGSFPSVKSREAQFYYEHPQNRFWRVAASVFEEAVPRTAEEKRRFLLRNRIALWDVIASCEIEGSADQTIKNVIPNDLSPILAAAEIKRIFVNGRKAEEYYNKLILPNIGRKAVYLPSTSSANALMKFERLVEAWKAIRQDDRQRG